MGFEGMLSPFQVGLAFSGLLCALIIGIFLISILIAIWVYRDAESRGMSGVLWLIVVLFFGLIGLIVYLVVRHDRVVPTMVQPYYGPQGWMPPPGAPPPTGPASGAQATCRSCGSPLAPGAAFCPNCGAKV